MEQCRPADSLDEPLDDSVIVCTRDLPTNVAEAEHVPNAYREAAVQFLFVMDRVMEWMRQAKNHNVAWWQVQFALGTSHCLGRTMSDVANEVGVKKAAISKGSTELCRQCNIPPSAYMKRAEAQKSYQQARRKQISA